MRATRAGAEGPFLDLSPSLQRTGRACAWIEEGGQVLMAGRDGGGWTLPGGGIHPGESDAEAALREAWEECGAHAEVTGEPLTLRGASGVDALCFPLRLTRPLDPSPEGRPVAWLSSRALPCADDVQLRQVLAARGETPAFLARPALVEQALAEAARLGVEDSSSLEAGRLRCTLAASRPGGRLLELGTGLGVGTAWLLSGMDRAARLTTAELDPVRAQAAWQLLRPDHRAEVVHGDGRDLLPRGPFDLIVVDGVLIRCDVSALDQLVSALRPGGQLVVDDLTPPAHLSQEFFKGDALRQALFAHPELSCTEIGLSPHERVVLATRRA
ncbi:class I SAM-dependent methyltransferase [Deinococcus hohokamensis]|uniref:Class I SAM-dependent methyltransferase n=1 Tax=Deinococcus hohokamensis TaxID=309883 RepID=A0ABV9I9P5_9DEIO